MSRVLVYPLGSKHMVRVIDDEGKSVVSFPCVGGFLGASSPTAKYFNRINQPMPILERLVSKAHADYESVNFNGVVSQADKCSLRDARIKRLTSLIDDYAEPTMSPQDLADIWVEVESELDAMRYLK